MEAEEENHQDLDPTIIFETIMEDDYDEKGNQMYQWIRDVHLDNHEGNPNPKIAQQAEKEGINVQKLIVEEVNSNSGDSFQRLMREPTRTTSASTPLGGTHLQFETFNSHSRSNGDEDNFDKLSKLEVRSGSGQRESPSRKVGLSLFIGEQYYTHATQDEDHRSRDAGPKFDAVGKDYIYKEKFIMEMSQKEKKINFYEFWIYES